MAHSAEMTTVTPLVQSVFGAMFSNQIIADGNVHSGPSGEDQSSETPSDSGQSRESMEEVQFDDCGHCALIQSMRNMNDSHENTDQESLYEAIVFFNIFSSDQDILEKIGELTSPHKQHNTARNQETTAEWVGSPIKWTATRKFYSAVMINTDLIHPGDCVCVRPEDPNTATYIGRVQYMFDLSHGNNMTLHVLWFQRGCDTILGNVADPAELFVIDLCDDIPAESVITKVKVITEQPMSDGRTRGWEDSSRGCQGGHDDQTFFCHKWYNEEFARFEDPPTVDEDFAAILGPKFCLCCHRLENQTREKETSVGHVIHHVPETCDGCVYFGCAKRDGCMYNTGDCCYLQPGAFQFSFQSETHTPCQPKKNRKVDEDIYPEAYRKAGPGTGRSKACSQPFLIGHIEQIFCPKSSSSGVPDLSQLQIRVRKFYRPENTHMGAEWASQSDLNHLYWSDEEAEVDFSLVRGKCKVVFQEDMDFDSDSMFLESHIFYFTEAYNAVTMEFKEPPSSARSIGRRDQVKCERDGEKAERTANPVSPLRTLDVFAGAGGLSEGLWQAGVCMPCWAIDNDVEAATAYQMNHPDCTVFVEDCNVFLRQLFDGKSTDTYGHTLPQKRDVEMLCGGPPCQGFSGLNRFSSSQYSRHKNSLTASLLSACDFFRPRFFLLENVCNFVHAEHGLVLKMSLKSLLLMGYQCTFGMLQAGGYGMPQTRRRVFILAAAPGEKLPSFPEPLHTVPSCSSPTTIILGSRKYRCTSQPGSAPYRTITVRDAVGDLPCIENGAREDPLFYTSDPLTHFQRLARGKDAAPTVGDHVCKDMGPLAEARIRHIPVEEGADWRDLPNIVVSLSDGSTTNKLIYTHDHKQNGRSSNGSLRGVCSCAEGKACDPAHQQVNTLIPWCLPHTANRHSHYQGLYGRLDWGGYFSTVVTSLDPLGKQGRVLHPEQHRIVSVRECARSQGFCDSYRFCGSLMDKHKQVGNAVPPPLARCIGKEIARSLCWPQDIKTTMSSKTEGQAFPGDRQRIKKEL